ncbi:hypothetical protein Tco_0433087 [Tanacetum coccineum]
MVAYLQKPEGSEAFHQIMDFLNASHIKYALIDNSKIYISLIQQFWGTATARTTDNGEVEITASIDGQVKTITEASLRRHLKLEDSDSITSLPNTEIFEQLALMWYVFDSARFTFQKGHFSPQWRVFIHTILHLADEAAFTSVDVDAGGAATTDIGLEAGQGSGTMHKTPTRPHDSPLPRVHTLGSDEGSLQQNELMDLLTKLTDRVVVLENEMQQTKKVYSSSFTKLILRVKKLEKKVKTNKARRRTRTVISEDKDAEEDSSKQGRKISKIDKDPTISLVQLEQDMEYDFDVSTAERFTIASVPVTTASAFISTASASISTASATPEVSIAAANLVYIRRSAEKRKDKGEAIMKEDESINEEENQRIVRDAEIAKQLQEEFDIARQEQEVVAEADQAHDIDWSNRVVLRYHALQNRPFFVAEVKKNMCMYLKNQGGYKQSHFKGMNYEDIRPIFERVWDQNNAFIPKVSDIRKEVVKRHGFDFQQKSSKNRSREDSDEDNAKKQKLKDDVEKKEVRDSMDVVPRDEIAIDIESLATKYLIIIFEPNEEDEIRKNQQDYNLISWRLFDSFRIHMLLMHNGIAIHLMIEKKYPFTQEMISRMLSRRLEVDQESEMAFELLRFIRSQLQK